MKISDFMPQIKTENKIQKVKEGQDSAKVSSGSSVGNDRVELSAGSLDVQKMKEIIQEAPTVRLEKVQALKTQIENGEYQVDSYRVADKMLMNLLFESRPGEE
jgi:negative regulator of flagellin synthesis FlgM